MEMATRTEGQIVGEPRMMRVPFKAGDIPTIQVKFTNNGNTPAISVEPSSWFGLVDEMPFDTESEERRAKMLDSVQSTGPIAKDGFVNIQQHLGSPLTDEEISDINAAQCPHHNEID
jgi:hypothetical protein